MDRQLLEQKKAELIKKYGPWTGHNIQLPGNLYTIGEKITGDEIKLKRNIQIIADATQKPLNQLRVLDLACLEGLYSVELARQGAKVVGIEGREANLEKARFAKEAFGLNNLDFFLDDVRNLSQSKYGSFDVVLCLGILYHLDEPDVFYFLEKISEVCTGLAIIDTHISLSAKKTVGFKGQKYQGKYFREHTPWSSLEKRKKALWASLDNVKSFWPTRESLINLLANVGFTSVYGSLFPPDAKEPRDRVTLVALKGKKQQLLSTPLMNEVKQS
ncbi:MAG: class I SAM-dependent methyltransferase [Candidatus Margulisbacteria bacterium]|nr:class I SAM-dependent methyltransferase [Candidatus Margulisiibacteriota bacterium]